jgi:beta-phosphoglucomutase-like phosphatase (HAD superfamily)
LPTSKPDPAVYRLAGWCLNISSDQGLAIEDSVNGTVSAVAAGFRVVGTVQFVPTTHRPTRGRELIEAGAGAVVREWAELVELLGSS